MRLVDLDAVIDCLEVEWGYEGIREDLYSLPVVDAVPLRHGHWIKDGFFSDEVNNAEKCSQCGELIGWFGNLPKYCPGCGALLDGGKGNG